MLLHSKTLYRLYPEQTWLANLQKSGTYDQDSDNENSPDAPKFCKPKHTAYKLRQLEAVEKPVAPLEHLINLLTLRKAS